MSSKKNSQHKLSFFARPLFGRFYWRRIKITDGLGLSSKVIKNAKEVAGNHPNPKLPAFEFTEARPEWVLLYDLARQGQITPEVLRNMRRSDLYYLAGHTFPHPGLMQPKDPQLNIMSGGFWDDGQIRWDQVTKLQGNASRARNELDRRNFITSSFLVVLAALLGGILGSGIWQ
jgi:hypothetical protein